MHFIFFLLLLKHHKDVQCVYWNFNKNSKPTSKSQLLQFYKCSINCAILKVIYLFFTDGHGGWDDYGCRKNVSDLDYTTCLCDHLTHFGVLLV